MKVGDLRVFNSDIGWFYKNRLFVVTQIDDAVGAITINIIDVGFTDHWDRINLLHDSKTISDKKCP